MKKAWLSLTAGRIEKEGGFEPDHNAKFRLDKGIDGIRRCHFDSILVVGGESGDKESLAQTDAHYIEQRVNVLVPGRLPPLTVEATAKLTARDLRNFVRSGRMDAALGIDSSQRDQIELTVIVYQAFFRRAKITLEYFGYTNLVWIDSQEKPHYPWWKEELLYIATLSDPCLDSTWLGNRIAKEAESGR